MKVNRSSWHCRAVDLAFSNPSNNLCRYFWQVVWACLFVPVLIAFVVAFFLIPFWWWLVPDNVMIVGAIGVGIVEIWLLCIFWQEYRRELRSDGRLPPKKRKEKEPSLLAEWLRAKKQKICPLLEFE